MEDVMSNYVFSDENVARYANEEDDHRYRVLEQGVEG